MLRNVDAESFAGALNDGLRDNHTEAQFAAMKPQIEALNANLKAVGEAKKGALILFEFIPGAGTRVTEGGQPRGTVIPGEEFFTFVHEIEIGDVDGDGKLEFFATPTDRNKANESQPGMMVMYRWNGTQYERSVVDPMGATHAKEILAATRRRPGRQPSRCC